MNSEELEQSLRAEFETHLKGVLAQMSEDVNEFKTRIEAEVEKHKSQIDEAFRGFSTRFDSAPALDGAFTESVVEHLRLARDEGAKITATAMAEAEDIERAANPDVNLAEIKEALTEISSKDSQAAILKSLISHAAKYTPRGAFFIIKNDSFVGWKVFGDEAGDGESTVRDINFPLSADTVLGGAVNSQSLTEGSYGTYTSDDLFLERLKFGRPDRMYAIPLVARGRGVAVLYADYGKEGVSVNTDALEMLVRVAGLTVEMLASAKTARSGAETESHSDFSDTSYEADDRVSTPVVKTVPEVSQYDYSYTAETPAQAHVEEPVAEAPAGDYAFTSNYDDNASEYVAEEAQPEAEATPTFETAEFESTQPLAEYKSESIPTLDDVSLSNDLNAYQPTEYKEPAFEITRTSDEVSAEPEIEYELETVETAQPFDPAPFDQPVAEKFEPAEKYEPVEKFEPAGMIGSNITTTTAPVVEKVSSAPSGARLSDRHVDLPIEVADDERRLHNDARRFARLLVSEIKLYNEKRVQEGRQSSDLYDRLREAIDRSREMYDKRVQPPVASKFDYFHYELVNSLAEGEESRLGNSYPGAAI